MSRRRVRSWAGVPVGDLRERWGREQVYVYGEIDSTMDAARELADDGAPEGTVVMSKGQTAGRGRGGSSFHSPSGAGVYLSMIFRPKGDWMGAPLTVLAGLGVATRLEEAFPDLSPRLKWPNDLIARDRKLGGILAESARSVDGVDHLIVGVGVNLETGDRPAELEGRVIGIRECCDAEAADVADAVVAGLEDWLREPPERLSEASLAELDRLDWLKDRRVILLTDGASIVGRAAGLAPDGALLFRPDRGALRRVTSGSIEALEETQ